MRQPPAPVMPYGTKPNGGMAYYWLAHFLLWAAVIGLPLGIMTFVVPRFERIFADFHTTLPVATRGVLAVSRWISGAGWIFVGLAPVGIATIFTMAGAGGNPRRMLRFSLILAWLFLTGAVVLAVLSMFLPLVTLMEAVSGGGR